MTQRTQEAIDVFLDALNEGTLAKGSCAACAVGNLAAFGMGVKIKKCNGTNAYYCDVVNGIRNDEWSYAFCTDSFEQSIYESKFDLPIFQYFKFTPSELAKIEYAFERNSKINFSDYDNYTKEDIRDDQIKGLEAVVKIMLELDENIQDNYQEVFSNKALALAIN